MELLKFFRPENTTVPLRPSVEQLSNLIKTSLHYPESFNHPFHQKRSEVYFKIFLQCPCAHTRSHFFNKGINSSIEEEIQNNTESVEIALI